jgi:WD40 repeat protein
MKKICGLSYMCIVIFLLPIFAHGQDTQVQFGRNIGILRLNNQVFRYPALSPDGNFVFANADHYQFDSSGNIVTTKVLDTIHLLWDLPKFKNEASVMRINSQKIDLNSSAKAQQGFSPNNQYLAVKTKKEIQIFTLPNMKILHSTTAIVSINSGYDHYLSWSPDSRLLASWADGEVIVWDIQKNIVYRYPLNYKLATIQYIENGWFIQILDRATSIDTKNTDPFIVCSLQLESCDTYEDNDQHTRVLGNNGQIFLTQSGDSAIDGTISIWKRSADGIYKLDTQYSIDKPPINQQARAFCSQTFSPNGVYVVSGCPPLSTQIWEVSPLKFRQELLSSLIVWLPDSIHFVSWDYRNFVLRLYEVGNDNPLDVLALEKQSGLEDMRKWSNGFPAPYELIDISRAGNRILINLGLAALVVPIEYQ